MPSSYAVSVVDDEITLHRPCFGLADPLLLYALRSNHENRGGATTESETDALLSMGISMFEDVERLARLARRRPTRLGTHIMTLILLPGFGICTAATGSPGHHSVWGSPHHLLGCITAVRPLS